MRFHLARQRRQALSLDLINTAPTEPEHVDKPRSRLDLDQAEMVEQLQRWRHRLARYVVIQPEVGVAHARAATVTDGPLDRREHSARAPGHHLR
jgi:hypothetical protein